ncbi:AraC family transcriptional regulator [Halobacillus litoralis]|uniref:AraC family transcriptional regulator n=1 Tax=Halobacillus litoralis TaxID=45668 RepID=A0A410MHX3_9BACI|nr:AraC family transcriptional regulator [Halobacillus litoralis]QAS54332.1 AraC family transcriptional regulator [Halobacillus litoralis]
MNWVQTMQQAVDYMENHLLDEITIDEIAASGCTSPFHFQRIFSLLTDTTVAEYLRRRRLTLAASELNTTKCKIIDLACKYGYETPESFSRAFRNQHGISPREARNNQGKVTAYNRLVIQVNLKGAEPMQYEIIEREAFETVGIKKELSCVNGENLTAIPQMWKEVNTDGTDQVLIEQNNGQVNGILGICIDKSHLKPNYIDYWIAVAHEGKYPVQLEKLEIPAAKWAVFAVNGAMPDAIQKVWKEIYSEWFPSSGYENAGGPELEVYKEGDPESDDYYCEIWIPVK